MNSNALLTEFTVPTLDQFRRSVEDSIVMVRPLAPTPLSRTSPVPERVTELNRIAFTTTTVEANECPLSSSTALAVMKYVGSDPE